MADLKISQLSAATALAGTEVVPVVQSGATKKATIDQILKPAAGNGIDYSANTPAAGMTSQLLTWYEEGTFTATLTATTTGPATPITATANYVRIGKTVTVCVSFLNVDTTGASGTTKITGLPFTPSAIAQLSTTSNIASTPTIAQIGTGQPWMELTDIQTAAGAAITASAGRYLFISGTYFV